jgi:enamine deaminase RidA (YjgF/YER057c/UK114 family)
MARRQTISIPGVPGHRNPIPQGARIDKTVYSSAISGADADSGDLPGDAETQVHNTFRNVKLFVEAAGGDIDDIVRMTVYLRDLETRQFVNDAWLAMFPNESNRPARYTMQVPIDERYHVQVDLVAMLP